MGRKELVLINLAPASSPCLLTGLFSLSFSHLPSRCAPSLQVELVLHFVLVVRRGGGCFWTCLLETGQERTKNEKVRIFHKQRQEDVVVYLPVICAACFLLLFLVLPLGASSSYGALAGSRSSSAGTSRSVATRATRDKTGRRPKAADAGNGATQTEGRTRRAEATSKASREPSADRT